MLVNLVYSQVGLGEIREAYASVREALQFNVEGNSTNHGFCFRLWVMQIFSRRKASVNSSVKFLGLCINIPKQIVIHTAIFN